MASTATQFDSDCVLMLHMDGTDASTTFTDSSDSAHSPSAIGDAQIDTAQSVFGSASALFDGAGDRLSIADSADWDLGTGDFTCDFRVRWNGTVGGDAFIDRNEFVTFDIRHQTGGGGLPAVVLGGTESTFSNWTPSADTWYHVAVVRSGTNLYFFVDGTQIGATATNAGDSTHTDPMIIGSSEAGGADFTGWIDELRLVKGTAVWTANFTPPSAAYTRVTPPNFNGLMMLGVS